MSTSEKCRTESPFHWTLSPGTSTWAQANRLHDEVVDGHLDDTAVVDLSPEGEQLVHAGRPTHVEVRSGLLALREPSRDGLRSRVLGTSRYDRASTRGGPGRGGLRWWWGGRAGLDAVRDAPQSTSPAGSVRRPGADDVVEIQAGVPGDLARQGLAKTAAGPPPRSGGSADARGRRRAGAGAGAAWADASGTPPVGSSAAATLIGRPVRPWRRAA